MRMGSVNSDLWHAAVVSQEASGHWLWEARCGARIAEENKHTDSHDLSLAVPKVRCSRCVALLAIEGEEAEKAEEIERKNAMVHWEEIADDLAVCGWTRGRAATTARLVTCPDCREAPGYREKLLEEVRDELVHYSLPVDPASVTGAWPVACGSNNTLKEHRDLSLVTCMDCIRAGLAPKVDEPPKRRILLDGND